MKTGVSLDFHSSLCQRLHDYWWEIKHSSDQTVPKRSDFDPAAVKDILPHILMHDLGTPGRSILRLVGTGVVDRLGFDPTGRDYVEFVSEDRKEEAYNELFKTASFPCGMRVVVEGRYQSGQTHISEALGYPLSANRDGHPLIIFVDDLIEKIEWHQKYDKQLEYYKIKQRDYIDIGFGVPLAG
ncbi:PAS domain-containing protein [Kiloniella sp.]|uniref:PAS domain-containing protein n=1 Tax=Kiloniella sp. TaxID=1938587 RepID=UPI003B02132B